MISAKMIMAFITIWFFFFGLLALAIIYDGIYIQLIFDFSIMLISGLIGYIVSSKQQKSK